MKIRLRREIAPTYPGVHWTFGFTPHGQEYEAVEVFFPCFSRAGYPPPDDQRIFALIELPRHPLNGYFPCVGASYFEIVKEQNPAPKSN